MPRRRSAPEYKNGVRVGSIGDIGCFSFFPSKNSARSAMPDFARRNDAELAERMRVLRVHGGKPKYFHALIGGNFRIDELQAAVLRVKLKYLDGWTEARQRNAAYYDRAFAQRGAGRAARHAAGGGRRAAHLQPIRRARAAPRCLEENSSASGASEPRSTIRCRCICSSVSPTWDTKRGDFPHSEQAAAETLALPIYPELSEAQLGHVVASVAEFYG